VVTAASGTISVLSGSLKWARDIAEVLGLKPVAGTPVGREEWVRESLHADWATSRHPSAGFGQTPSA